MKKRKILLLLAVLFGIMFIPLFSGCKKGDGKIQLITPESVTYQINFDTGKQLLVTQKNPFASSYIFGFSENSSTSPDDFIHIESSDNYCDVSNYFVNASTYYFYAQYVGSENYSTSPISRISSHKVQFVLERPQLSINDCILNWTSVLKCSDYSIYSIIGGVEELVANRVDTYFNVSEYVNTKLGNGLDEAIKFTVVANPIQNSNYLRSPESNYVSYSAFLQLSTPEIISVNNQSITFKSVEHCDSYTLCINLNYTLSISKQECNKSGNNLIYSLSQYFLENGLGEYTFKIKSNSTNHYIQSEYSDIYTYTYTQKLNAPSEIIITNQSPYVVIYWNPVIISNDPDIYVSEYELFFSDVKDNYKLKQLVVNESGVESSIVTNSVMLTFEQMNISSFDELNNSRFKLQVRSKGKGYYIDSSFCSQFRLVDQDNSLKAPVITDNESLNRISWLQVANATSYKVTITGPISREIYTVKNYFEYDEFLAEAGQYTIVCYSVSDDDRISQPSNSIEKTVAPKNIYLDAPVLSSISLDDDILSIDFTPVNLASTYSLYVYDTLVTDNITKNNKSINLQDVLQYKKNNQLSFQLKANGYEHYIESEKSNSVLFNTKLQTPFISLNSNSITWQAIDNATSYTLILDDVEYKINSIDTNIDLTHFVTDINIARQVRLFANNLYLDDSDISNVRYYNRADRVISNFTNRYFYYGQTYDYYITSQKEFYDVLEYTYLNFLPSLNIYVNYDLEKTIIEKYDEIWESIHGTLNFVTNIPQHTNVGNITITFNYADKSREPDYDLQYTNFAHDMKYVANSTRDANYQFASDNYLVSQDVYTTDGLLSAIQNHAKPIFKTSNYVAKDQYTVEDVYNRAKEILIEICDDSMTDYEKILSIHDYVVTNVEYDYTGKGNVSKYNEGKSQLEQLLGYYHYIESAIFYNFAVCDGYAKLFSLLCNMEQIDCVVVNGLEDSTDRDSGHAWNKVAFDLDGDGEKEWFAVDCTFDDQPTTSKISILIHQYFLIPDTYLSGRSEDTNNIYPYQPTSNQEEKFYSYYTVDDIPLKIESPMELSQQAMKYMNPALKFNLELLIIYDEDHQQMIDQILSGLSMFNIHYIDDLEYHHDDNYKLIYLYR